MEREEIKKKNTHNKQTNGAATICLFVFIKSTNYGENCAKIVPIKKCKKTEQHKTKKHNIHSTHKMCTKCILSRKPEQEAREVTIVVLIILAGITLNAVIGEGGIIFQARDTRNKISNETTYDNAQLAQLQNELKDNGLYSGIGIIPGTDNGGSSEGGENGTGSTNQGGQTNSGGNNPGHLVNSGNNQQTGPIIGGDAEDPIIKVLEGEQVAASFYRSDVTIQIYTQDRTQRIKYILTTTVEEINNELYPSGLVKELDIENGGTLTFTKNGEYTITAYAYDTQGQKSNPVVMWFKRETDTRPDSGITLTASGNKGDNDWYTSNVTIRVLGTDAGSARVTYRVQGNVYEKGTIGNYGQTYEYEVGEITPREIEIANGTTIKVATDGEFTFTAYTYDEVGNRISTSAPLTIKRDATRPVIRSFTGEQVIQDNIGQGFQVSVDAIDRTSGLNTLGNPTSYTYQYKLAPSTDYDIPTAVANTSKLYANLDATKTYDMYVIVKDEAGNRVSSDVISKPAFWISRNPNQSEGEQINEGKEGSLQYTRSPEIEFSFKGQDSNNVDMSKIEYQVEGTATEDGMIDGISYIKDQPVNQTKEYLSSNGQDKVIQTFNIATDGDWTVKVHTYNKEGRKVTTNMIRICRDTVVPTVRTFEVTSKSTNTADVLVTNDGFGISGQASGGGYIYKVNNVVNQRTTVPNTTLTGLTRETSYSNDLLVCAIDKAGNSHEINATDTTIRLIHKCRIGDYVDFNAGNWHASVAEPVNHGEVGGVTAGQLVSTGLDGSMSGWFVSAIDADKITLTTAGCPAHMRITSGTYVPSPIVPSNGGNGIRLGFVDDYKSISNLGCWTLREWGDKNYYPNITALGSKGEYFGFGTQGSLVSCTVEGDMVVYKRGDFRKCCDGYAYATSERHNVPEIGYGMDDQYYIKSDKYGTQGYASTKCSDTIWYLRSRSHTPRTIGLKGVMLQCDLSSEVLTLETKSNLYGDNQGWQVLLE